MEFRKLQKTLKSGIFWTMKSTTMTVVCYKLKLFTRIAKINKSLSWRRVSMSLLISLLFHIVASWLLRQVCNELRMNESVYWFLYIDTTITFTWPGTNAHPGGEVREFSKVKLWTMVNKCSKKYLFNLGLNLCSINLNIFWILLALELENLLNGTWSM